jgi:hypothetical protein
MSTSRINTLILDVLDVPLLSIVIIIRVEQQSTARSCGRQCERFPSLEKVSLIATPGLSERYAQELPKCPASFAKGPGDKTLYCSAVRTDFCDVLGISTPWYNQGSF